jgi:hypothetical protein
MDQAQFARAERSFEARRLQDAERLFDGDVVEQVNTTMASPAVLATEMDGALPDGLAIALVSMWRHWPAAKRGEPGAIRALIEAAEQSDRSVYMHLMERY